MLVDTLLLPRFLILVLVIFCHYFHFANSCHSFLHSSNAVKKGRSNATGGEEGCRIVLDEMNWKNQPLVYSINKDWLWPGANRVLAVESGEQLLLSCPGNSVNSTSSVDPLLVVYCGGPSFRDRNDQEINLDDHGCVKNPVEDEKKTELRCGPEEKGELIDIGFSIQSRYHSIFTYCHNAEIEHTYYSRHVLRGQTLQFNNVDQGRPSFKEGRTFYKSISASNSYLRRNQLTLFTKIIGDAASRQLLEDNYLARGHLSPDADFLFKDWQESTYYYGNAVPQWQSINNGNWKRLESKVRSKAESENRSLEIWTGALGIMKFKGEDGPQEVWLAKHNHTKYIPVPDYVFKLIIDEAAGSGLAVLCTNDPLIRRVTRSTILCTDVCPETGWAEQFNDRRQVEDGILFCCSPAEFVELAPWAGPENFASYSSLHY